MQANGAKVTKEKIATILKTEIENNEKAGKTTQEAAEIFGIKYAPLLNANSSKFSYSDLAKSAGYNDPSILDAIKKGMNISDKVLWENIDDYLEEDEKSNVEINDEFSFNNIYGIHMENKNNALDDNDPHICIGWSRFGDISYVSSKDDIKEIFEEKEPGASKSRINQCTGILYRFLVEAQKNDLVIYSTTKDFSIGLITSDCYYEEPNEELQDLDYTNKRDVKWLYKNLDRKKYLSTGLNSALTASLSFYSLNSYKDEIIELLNELNNKNSEKYTKDDFLKDVYIDEKEYDKLQNTLLNKKNLILQGAPGVGKTFSAKRLAYSILGKKDDSKIKFIQFHQNYSYEDFVMGYKPNQEGFKLEPGIFYEFCELAKKDQKNKYFMIIDEINRGNLSKIFGELLMLIEKDKREVESVLLAYNKKKFFVPNNLYIIGMMNTADRSLALIDYALRRRFSFYKMKPAYKNDKFKAYINSVNNKLLGEIMDSINELNKKISSSSLGPDFEIGHSYFCNLDSNCSETQLESIIDYEIIPMIEEYWFDDSDKINEAIKILKAPFND